MKHPVKPPRRKSLPGVDQEADKKLETKETKLEYYSSLLDRKSAQPKCLSDDNLEYAQPNYARLRSSRRVSVTAPNTPTVPRPPYLPESELSETESQSSVLSDALSPVLRPRNKNPCRESLSNSLESFHEPRGRRLRRPKAVRKASASSTSSCDARPEPIRRMRKSASCHSKGRETRRDWRDLDPVGDTCRYLMDVLHSRKPEPDRATKSLPRNHKPHCAISRHINDALRCEKDCLKILKSVSQETGPTKDAPRSPGAAYSRRGDSEESYFEGKCSSLPKRASKSRYPRTAEIKKLRSIAVSTAPCVEPPIPRFQTQTIERCVDIKKREKKPIEECVLRIEDGNLWLEICKAVQETETRARIRSQSYQEPH